MKHVGVQHGMQRGVTQRRSGMHQQSFLRSPSIVEAIVTVSITFQKVSCLLMVCCLREYHLTSTVGVTRGLGRARPEDQADTAGTTVVRS